MANVFGRQVVLPLVNKSGGSVIAGDVVVTDTTNNEAFTTSTAGAVTGGVGIAQETIASNATGRVLIAGYAALVNTSASVTRGNYGKTHTVVKQAVDAGASRVAGTFCQFLTGGTTPTARVFSPDLGAAAGNVAVDAIWDAAGDLAVGSGADTAVKLSKGAAGGVLSQYNGVVAWNAGTSFPASPAAGNRYYRSDIGLEFQYNGTRWLSTTLYRTVAHASTSNITTTTEVGRLGLEVSVYGTDIYLDSWQATYLVSGGTALSGSHKWAIACTAYPSTTTLTGAHTISSGTLDTWRTDGATSIGSLLGSDVLIVVNATKTGTPGALYYYFTLTYRLVMT